MTAFPTPESPVPSETSANAMVPESAIPESDQGEGENSPSQPSDFTPSPSDSQDATLADEPESIAPSEPTGSPEEENLTDLTQQNQQIQQVNQQLLQQKETLQAEITALETQRDALDREIQAQQSQLAQMIRIGLEELHNRKRDLQQGIEQLERRQERIQTEMRQNFAGVSQDLAIRVQSFKEYLVGSLQELVAAAEDLNLVPPAPPAAPVETTPAPKKATAAAVGDEGFKGQTREIRRLLDQYRTNPDYYGPAWQLRRTFEPIHAERVSNWFFEQGGRGAIRGLGTRSQNILVASAIISILTEFYGEQLVTLVLANTPESLGEWRRGLQDCLGISRADFGPNQGIALYEDPAPLVQKADRLVQARDFPLVIIDEAEALIDLSLLQFPLWLAFVSDPRRQSQWT
jgi:hypothetical protein